MTNYSQKQKIVSKIIFTFDELDLIIKLMDNIDMNETTKKKIQFIFSLYNKSKFNQLLKYKRANLPIVWFSDYELDDFQILNNRFPLKPETKEKINIIIQQYRKTTYKAKGECYPVCNLITKSNNHQL